MIEKIHIQNFKAHRDTSLNLGNLTLLAGQNGVGKSSIIQTLLLLRQTFQKGQLHKGLSLNKPLVYLGTAQDILHKFASNDEIIFNLKMTDADTDFIFHYAISDMLEKGFIKKVQELNLIENQLLSVLNLIQNLSSQTPYLPASQEIKNMEEYLQINAYNSLLGLYSLFDEKFQYIGTFRGIENETDEYNVEEKRQISLEEGKAENTAHFLYHYQNEEVLAELIHTNSENNTLLAQTNAWAKEISEGIKVIPKKISNNYIIEYAFEGFGQENTFSSRNVAFGINYTLPIIVAILSAPKDALILIENPEAHLHPYAQSKLTELICLASQAGIQIIVETHSDHIANGVLVQSKKFETQGKGIHRQNIKIYYFDRDEANKNARASEVEILEDGRILHPPKGFFDQIDKDLKDLLK